jgi:hypothetical protein
MEMVSLDVHEDCPLTEIRTGPDHAVGLIAVSASPNVTITLPLTAEWLVMTKGVRLQMVATPGPGDSSAISNGMTDRIADTLMATAVQSLAL